MQQNNQAQFKETEIGLIPKDWELNNFENISVLVTDYVANGSFASLKKNVRYTNNIDYAILIRLVDFNNNFSNNFVYINEDGYNFLKKTKLFGGEIIISNVGEYSGTVFLCPKLIKPMTLGPNSIMLKTKYDDKFYFYWFNSVFGKDALNNIKSGSAVPKFNKTDFKKIIAPIPPLFEQQKISEILSSLDDKIELLKQQNKTLESIGQIIFKRWFVDFEFPDENGKPYKSSGGKMIDGELGEMPEGWRVGSINENYLSDTISSGINPFDNEKIYLATADVSDLSVLNASEIITFKNRPSRANMQPLIKSVWFAKMQNSRKLLMFDDYSSFEINNYILSTGFCGLKTNDISHYYVWSYILTDNFDDIKNNLASGAVQIALNNESLSKIRLFFPDIKILSLFNIYIKNIFEKIYYNSKEIKTLSQLRDSLLPKLMSGKIRVK